MPVTEQFRDGHIVFSQSEWRSNAGKGKAMSHADSLQFIKNSTTDGVWLILCRRLLDGESRRVCKLKPW